jgi:hypothetical protein
LGIYLRLNVVHPQAERWYFSTWAVEYTRDFIFPPCKFTRFNGYISLQKIFSYITGRVTLNDIFLLNILFRFSRTYPHFSLIPLIV